jgi:hypothetical protein
LLVPPPTQGGRINAEAGAPGVTVVVPPGVVTVFVPSGALTVNVPPGLVTVVVVPLPPDIQGGGETSRIL